MDVDSPVTVSARKSGLTKQSVKATELSPPSAVRDGSGRGSDSARIGFQFAENAGLEITVDAVGDLQPLCLAVRSRARIR